MITDLNKESKIALDIFNAKVIRKASLKKEKPFKNTITKKTSEEICSSTYVCTKYQLVFEDCPPYEVCIFDTQNECWWETVCYNDSYSFPETPLYDPYNCYDNPGTPWCKEGCNDCGDGSGGTPSPVFKYPLGSNYETEYPKFTNTVKNIADYVFSNPKILATLKYYTGLTSIEIYEKLQYGQGPTVLITQLNNAYGYHNPFTNTVQIDIDYVKNLENSTGSSAELLNLMLSITLLHEFVHWTDGLFFDYSQENGNNWEIATYGFVVNMGNVSIIREP